MATYLKAEIRIQWLYLYLPEKLESLGWVLLFKLTLGTEEVVHPMAYTFWKVHTKYVDAQMKGSDFSPA